MLLMVLHSRNNQSYTVNHKCGMNVCKEIQSNPSNYCHNISLKAKHFSRLVEQVLAITKVIRLYHECLNNILMTIHSGIFCMTQMLLRCVGNT